jgi:death-on-curing family protein
MIDSKFKLATQLLENDLLPNDVAKSLGISVPTLYRCIPSASRLNFSRDKMSNNTINEKMQIIRYKSEEGKFQIDVQLGDETIWLNQKQMGELFDKDVRTINEHIKNIFKDKELNKNSTIRNFRIVQIEGTRRVKRSIDHYNLDMIISVGYRVNSKKGTQFRIWANQILKEYLIKGYALNESKLKKQTEQIKRLKEGLKIIQSAQKEPLGDAETKGLLLVLSDYTNSFILLNQYDTGNFSKSGLCETVTEKISFDEAIEAIDGLKKRLMSLKEATPLFGSLKDYSFDGILGNIVQSFDGKYLYQSIEEQAAHLLYFIVKNHPFVDGNKRIGAFMFIWFLQKNHHHLKKDGEKKVNDNALVAITLMVAQSLPDQKDIMIELIINLIKTN